MDEYQRNHEKMYKAFKVWEGCYEEKGKEATCTAPILVHFTKMFEDIGDYLFDKEQQQVTW